MLLSLAWGAGFLIADHLTPTKSEKLAIQLVDVCSTYRLRLEVVDMVDISVHRTKLYNQQSLRNTSKLYETIPLASDKVMTFAS